MAIGMLTAFWVVSFSLVMVPGADWAYAISAGMRERAIAPAIAGMLAGYVAITLVVAAGVGVFVASVPMVLTVLTFAGAAYLLWLGANILMRPSSPGMAGEQGGANATVSGARWRWALKGFTVSGMNPKALLLFLALLPQFTRQGENWSIPAQMTVLGFIQILNCAVVYTLVAVGAKVVLSARPKAARMVSRVSGAAMIVIALLLLVEAKI